MLRIWGRANSTNVRKVLWCAAELDLAHEHVNAGGAFGIVGDAAYLAINPNGLVPCLQDGDWVLWESNVIVRYLARAYGASLFAETRDAKAWAEAEKWMDWASLSFAAPFRDVFWNLIRVVPEQRDAGAIERGAAQCARLLTIADAALARAPYLSGQRFGVGDIPLGCIAYGWFNLPIERPDLPHLADWYQRLSERPAYRQTVMTPLT